jgi:hypothetical protein
LVDSSPQRSVKPPSKSNNTTIISDQKRPMRIGLAKVAGAGGAQPFVLVGKLTTAEASETFLKWRDVNGLTVRSEHDPLIAKIRSDGIQLWHRKRDWRGGKG